jgi:hypothetical protein
MKSDGMRKSDFNFIVVATTIFASLKFDFLLIKGLLYHFPMPLSA